MNNTKPKTIDEFFIEKYQKLEEENKELQAQLLTAKENEINTKNLLKKMKDDFGIKIRKQGINEKPYIKLEVNYIWSEYSLEIYEYYKNLFNLKDEDKEIFVCPKCGKETVCYGEFVGGKCLTCDENLVKKEEVNE